MARQRKEKPVKGIKLSQPDRSGPTEKTLLDLAEERKLFAQADERMRRTAKDADTLSPGAERVMEAILWTATIAMVHLSFDALVHQQYAVSVEWPEIWKRAGQAWLMFFFLFYILHPHDSSPNLVPGVPTKYQPAIRQAIFTVLSAAAGCYLIYVTNEKGYMANMKRAPPIACLWLWCVVELDLLWAILSLVAAGVFFWQGNYTVFPDGN
ncbi:hypothetical protein B0I35DRAFT_483338 [Stachybotrys elegans]|uniref:DUF7719 domain-containing protein n=1 Tax=Stachybotrys elegans TaxID=80388 RepID=A0A8K0WMK5_9HYPO|nr:hypothetical protein B0I35DRAFT_483338 [Stachybotrys elegans]